MKKIKVLFFYPNEFLGPEMTVYAQIIRHLGRDRFAPHLVVNSRANGILRLSEEEGVTVRRWDFGLALRGSLRAALGATLGLPTSMISLIRYAIKENIDVVQCSAVARTGALGLMLARLTCARLLLHYHVVPGRFAGKRGFFERAAALHADRAVAVSSFLAEQVLRSGVSANRIDVVRNGVDLRRFRPDNDGSAMRQEYGLAPGAPLVLQLGRIHQGKRQEDLVRAFAIARRRVLGLRCLLVGWEDDRYNGSYSNYTAELRHICEQENLGDSLIIGTARPEAAELMAAADIVAMPSLDEGFCLVVAEAMATGKPVIGADSGGITELISDGVTGFLVPPKSPEVLSEKIVLLAESADLRAKMGQSARRRAETVLGEERLAAEFAPIYEALTGHAAPIGLGRTDCGDPGGRPDGYNERSMPWRPKR
ncbi:MAG: glycosyltransferase family 4 protein [Chloroflexi bacterium]|nr:glycosyltransferase family 4 protein [Chloroflexota bacterium]